MKDRLRKGLVRLIRSPWPILVSALSIALITGLYTLQHRSERERTAEISMVTVEACLDQLSILEETVAAERQVGPDIPMQEARYYSRISSLLLPLKDDPALHQSVSRIEIEITQYHQATANEFQLVNAGRWKEGEAFARAHVDPQFDSISWEVNRAYGALRREAQVSKWMVGSGTIGVLVLAAIGMALLFWRVERAKLETSLIAQAAAEQSNRAKSEFLSRMSHELRTPLNAVLGFGQLLEISVESPDDRSSVEQILKAGKHLLSLIDEVLDISRIEAGKLQISLESVRAGDVLEEVVQLMSPIAAQAKITIACQKDDLWDRYIRVDRQRIKQVLMNLLSNAIKYNSDSGLVTLACAAASDAGRLRILVKDTGQGIPANLLERLFMPFDRLNADQTRIGGTGLGLAHSKRLVEVMDGTISVESPVGLGSTFIMEFVVTKPISAGPLLSTVDGVLYGT